MKYVITINMDTTKAIYEQIWRNGCEIIREGEIHVVRVPNRALSQRMYSVVIDDHTQCTPQEIHNAKV